MYKLPYGERQIEFELPGYENISELKINTSKNINTGIKLIQNALKSPFINTLPDIINSKSIIAIAVSDLTRPVPNKLILPLLLDELIKRGAAKDKIKIIVGTGKHRAHNKKDFLQLLGEKICEQYNIISHNAEDKKSHTFLGYTSNRTPISIEKNFVEADLRIITGMIDPHQFMGFTGGLKAVTIGLGYKDTITANHKLMFNKMARLGNVKENLPRSDVDKIRNYLKIHFSINVILGDNNEIIKVLAGNEKDVWKQGVSFLRKRIFKVVKNPVDVVIASAGGYPKDIDLYQAQKALASAELIVKDGGSIILVAECREGIGNKDFLSWMKKYDSADEVIKHFRDSEFMLGAHKAYLFSNTLLKANVSIVSDKLSPELSSILKAPIFPTMQQAISHVFSKEKSNCQVAIIPKASSIIPYINQEG